jgi:phasin
MNAVYNPEVAADKAHERYPKGNGQFEALTLDTAFPETARVFAEKTVAQTREVYDRSKDALEAAVDTMEKSFDAAGQGAVALNRKIIDIAQRNVNSGFDLANSLAGAKNLAEMMELQGAYWRKQFGALAAQAEEVRALSTKVTADTAEPVTLRIGELRIVVGQKLLNLVADGVTDPGRLRQLTVESLLPLALAS